MLFKYRFNVFFILFTGFFFLSCEKHQEEIAVKRIPIGFVSLVDDPVDNRTRVSTYGIINLAKLQSSSDGFAVCTNGLGSGAEMNNVVVTYSGVNWNYPGDYYWPLNVNQPVSFTAYAPAGLSGASFAFSGLTLTNYIPTNNTNKQVDIIYAPPTNYLRTGGNVSLNFTHLFTQIVFSVTSDIPANQNPVIVSLQVSLPNSKGSFNGKSWSVSSYSQSYTVFNANPLDFNTPVVSTPIFVIPQPLVRGTNAKITIRTTKGTTYKLVDLYTAPNVKAWNQNTLVIYNILCTSSGFPMTLSAKVEERID